MPTPPTSPLSKCAVTPLTPPNNFSLLPPFTLPGALCTDPITSSYHVDDLLLPPTAQHIRARNVGEFRLHTPNSISPPSPGILSTLGFNPRLNNSLKRPSPDDFTGPVSLKKPNTKNQPPPTPRRPARMETLSNWTKKALQLGQLSPNELEKTFSNEETTFTYDRYLGSGQFINAHLFKQNGGLIVVKVPHFINTAENMRFSIVLSELINYVRLRENGFLVATHYNFDRLLLSDPRIEEKIKNLYEKVEQLKTTSVKRDLFKQINQIKDDLKNHLEKTFQDGYYLVEYVKTPYDLPSSEEEVIGQMNDETSYLHQLKEMFLRAFELKEPVDLQPDNIRIKEGKLILCDLYPLSEHGADENPFFPLIEHSIASFVKKLNLSEETRKKFERFLDPRV